MSILAEIAQRADVSVEGVLRVLMREPVSIEIKDRVLEVLTDLSPQETAIVQRFALAAIHEDLPRIQAADVEPTAVSAPATAEVEARSAPVLTELTAALQDLKRETAQDRRERVDDLALLIDVITTGWQGIDRRLGRVEHMLSRLERTQTPHRPAPLLVERPQEPAVVAPPALAVPDSGDPPRWRRWQVAAVIVAGLSIAVLAGLDLLPTQAQLSRLVPDGERAASDHTPTTALDASVPAPPAARPPAATTRSAGTSTRPAPPAHRTRTRQTTTSRTAPKPPPPTSAVLGTTATAPRSKPAAAPPAATTSAGKTSTGKGTFTPSRNWGWGPVKGADYYLVRFFRSGKLLYRATPAESSVHLPDSVVFPAGSYSWIVQPGFGKPAENRLGPPVVQSTFVLRG